MEVKKYLFLTFLLLMVTETISGSEKQRHTKPFYQVGMDSSLFRYLSASDRSRSGIFDRDSLKSLQHYQNGVPLIHEIVKIDKQIQNKEQTYEECAPKLFKLLMSLKDEYEQGLISHPFNLQLRKILIEVYLRLNELYAFRSDDGQRIRIIGNLLQMKDAAEEHAILFNQLGKLCFKHHRYEDAVYDFEQAVQIIFEYDLPAIDSVRLFDNLFYRGQSYLKSYDAEGALLSFERAFIIAPSQEDRLRLNNLIEFIGWDDGNLRASEQFQSALNFGNQGKYAEAEQAYLNLIPMVMTDNALNELQLELAIIQFDYLEKQEEAIHRLQEVVGKMLLSDEHALMTASLWENYGRMCYQLARKYYGQDRRLSLIYFLKTSQIDCSLRGSAYVALANLAVNQPDLCLNYCHRAYENHPLLSDREKKDLYHFFYSCYRTMGQFAEALNWFKRNLEQ